MTQASARGSTPGNSSLTRPFNNNNHNHNNNNNNNNNDNDNHNNNNNNNNNNSFGPAVSGCRKKA